MRNIYCVHIIEIFPSPSNKKKKKRTQGVILFSRKLGGIFQFSYWSRSPFSTFYCFHNSEKYILPYERIPYIAYNIPKNLLYIRNATQNSNPKIDESFHIWNWERCNGQRKRYCVHIHQVQMVSYTIPSMSRFRHTCAYVMERNHPLGFLANTPNNCRKYSAIFTLS